MAVGQRGSRGSGGLSGATERRRSCFRPRAAGARGPRAPAGLGLQGGWAQSENGKTRGVTKASGHPGAAASALLLKILKEATPRVRVTPSVEEVGETDRLSSHSGVRTPESLILSLKINRSLPVRVPLTLTLLRRRQGRPASTGLFCLNPVRARTRPPRLRGDPRGERPRASRLRARARRRCSGSRPVLREEGTAGAAGAQTPASRPAPRLEFL